MGQMLLSSFLFGSWGKKMRFSSVKQFIPDSLAKWLEVGPQRGVIRIFLEYYVLNHNL